MATSYCVEVRRRDAHSAAADQPYLTAALYFLQGDLAQDELGTLARLLLVDPVTETASIQPVGSLPASDPAYTHYIDVALLPGVTDSAAENLLVAAHELGFIPLHATATGQRHYFSAPTERAALTRFALEHLLNPVIQRFSIDAPIEPPFVPVQAVDDTVERIALDGLDEEALLSLSKQRRLSLDLAEMRAVQAYFSSEGRAATDAELEMVAQTWSEHCVHKTFKALIDYEDETGARQQIDGLLKTYIRAATEKAGKVWVRSAFVDNAGIIAFDERFDLAFKVETHNHPSALEPFGGANTGVGGVVRDILGVSARPIANTDVLCFGEPDTPFDALPSGVLPPNRIAAGVVKGIEDYGNKMGIPTVNGAILYHKGYTSNPLVYCGCVGILPAGSHVNHPQDGDLIVVLGGRTGRDGLRGATFSSMEMDAATGEIAGSAVQIGHPIHEKQAQEVVLAARDAALYHAITDCGAGGLSSAIGEMGAQLGATVHLERAPLKYAGLRPWEIWLSEAQERMVLAIPPQNWAAFKALADGQNIDAVAIGVFEATGRLNLLYGDKPVGNISMDFLHNGIPRRHLHAKWTPRPLDIDEPPEPDSLNDALLRLLAHPTIRSKESVIRTYDHEVQGGTAVKPLVGVHNHGPSDAAVIVPQPAQPGMRAVAVANGICPQLGELDPYMMAWAAVDEAFRNLVAVGADPDQVALLDNFCWGNPLLPDRLGALVRCAQGCYDAAVAYHAPFISGKDSLNNEYTSADGSKHAIPGTLLISALGIVPEVTKTVTMDLKPGGEALFVVGWAQPEIGGSVYAQLTRHKDGRIPQTANSGIETMRRLHQAIRLGYVLACHDISDGGAGVALAEMCIAGGMGASFEIELIPGAKHDIEREDIALFTETPGRFVVQVRAGNEDDFEALFDGVTAAHQIGAATSEPTFTAYGWRGNIKIQLPLSELERAWRGEVSPTVQSFTSAPNQRRAPALKTAPRVLILHANGSNRDHDAAKACELAGGAPEIIHINRLIDGERDLLDYAMLILPGGFSHGDDLGAGKLWALALSTRLREPIERFIASQRPVMGICNGFQALVKAGLLPGGTPADERPVTLTFNESAHFECRWVTLLPNPASPCVFTRDLDAPIYCPVAHGEGRFAVSAHNALASGLIALHYSDNTYPANPNGSQDAIAGICSASGTVFGLMPHPENHIFAWQHPRYHRGERGMNGLRLFENGIRYADA